MRRSEAYPSKYLSADDVGGSAKVVTIRNVSHELMADGRLRPVVYVDGYPKGIVVNKTNADVLYRLAGTDDDADWPGFSIEVHTEGARRPDGTPCEAIRFRVARPKPKVAKPAKVAKATKAEFDETNPPPLTEEELADIFD